MRLGRLLGLSLFLAGPPVLSAQQEASGPSQLMPREQRVDDAVRLLIIDRTLLRINSSRVVGGPTVVNHATSWTTNGRAIESVEPGDAPGVWRVRVHLVRSTADMPRKSGEIFMRLPRPIDASQQRWQLNGLIRVPEALIGKGPEEYLTPMRGRWVMRDAAGRRCYGPNTGCSLLPNEWIPVASMVPSAEVPMPKGLLEPGFDLSAITEIGFNIEAGNVPESPEITRPPRLDYAGTIELRDLVLHPLPTVRPREPAPWPIYRTPEDEAAAAPELRRRLRERFGLREGQMAIMVNIAWPFHSGHYHVYGMSLGATPWNDHQGYSFPATRSALRRDFQYLQAHGVYVARIFLFGDFRQGLEYDADGRPVAFDRLVYRDMEELLQIAEEEGMLLIPSLTDFLMADTVTREGPGLPWRVGEHPELLTRADCREALIQLLAQFVHDFNRPQVLMWELMNEPDNAVAVATPEDYNSLRQFAYTLAHALHHQGILTTVGSRHVGDYQRFWRGAVDVPQIHHWRLLESVENPYPVDTPAASLSPLPVMLSEVEPVAPEEIGPLLDRLRSAGYLMAGFWSLRGHDGYAFTPIAEAVHDWIDKQNAE